jgi:hypothetical protein
MKRTIVWIVAVLAAAPILAGCNSVAADKQTATDAPGSSNKAPAVPDDEVDAKASEAPSADSSLAKIGATSWYTYSDGIQAQVTKARRYTIGQYAAGGKSGDAGVIITVTLKNTTDKAFDTALTDVNLSSGPNGDTADSVYDSANGIGSGLEGSIAPGRSKTAEYAFAVPTKQLGDLMVEVAPSWEYSPAFFEGSAK